MLVVLLRPVRVFLLNLESLHIVLVHDLLDALIVVEDREARHLIEVRQVIVELAGASDEPIARVHESVALHLIVLLGVGEALLV